MAYARKKKETETPPETLAENDVPAVETGAEAPPEPVPETAPESLPEPIPAPNPVSDYNRDRD